MQNGTTHPVRNRLLTSLALVLTLTAMSAPSSCTKKGDSVVLTGNGTRLDSAEIDRDPLALLPSGPVGLFRVDVQAAVKSNLGSNVTQVVRRLLPLGPQANFEPQRDVQQLIGGMYTFSGLDSAVVVQGNFDPDAIRAAAEGNTPNAFGAKLTRVEYAGNDLFISGDVGFVVVTKHTLVAGNDTGIRRVLDRIRDNNTKRSVPDWMASAMDHPQASLVAVADLTGDVTVRAAANQAPFLNDLSIIRILGNFQPPGINLAGTLTYPDQARAQNAGESLKNASQLAVYTNLLALLGITPPIEKIEVATKQENVQFVASLNANGLTSVLGWWLQQRSR